MTSLTEWFFNLSDDEISIGLDIIHDYDLSIKYQDTDLISFVLDSELQRLAFLWLECNRNRILTRLLFTEKK